MMKPQFHNLFDDELLKSEKSRALILTTIFSIAVTVSAIVITFFSSNVAEIFNLESLHTIFYSQLVITGFELCSLLYIVKRLRSSKKHIPAAFQYLNTTLEISLPTILMVLLAQHFDAPAAVLHSPAANLYFIFVILSTLRLNRRLSIYTGFLAACQYAGLSIYLISHSVSENSILTADNSYIPYVAKSMVIFLSGGASGFVAKQISGGIIRSLREAEKKAQVVDLFRQQISQSVVDKMLERSGTLESKRMNVSVMFVDIRNFTKYVSDKSPEEIVNYQNAFFKIVIECVTKHDGIINQFLGDGCMITFGAPASLENPGQNAVDAALEIKQRIAMEVDNKSLPQTNIGVGIHTGEAVTGNIGNETRQQYSITGSVVILAARIEQLNKEFQSEILVSENVIQNTTGNFLKKSVNLGKISLKGWDEPIGIYKLA